ncbi:MAG: hypothetical protein R3F30_07865 [Planctomycetota bacterium]
MLPARDQPDVVRAAVQGDREAFLALVHRHAPAVRCLCEARAPDALDLDLRAAEAFVAIWELRRAVREPGHWPLFCGRTTQAHLDRQAGLPERRPEGGPAWLADQPLAAREAWLLHHRVEAPDAVPVIDYLGIAQHAYEARWQRAEAGRLKAADLGLDQAPRSPADDSPARITAEVAERLGPAPARRTGVLARLPRLPLALSFLLVLALSALLAALLFQAGTGTGMRPR